MKKLFFSAIILDSTTISFSWSVQFCVSTGLSAKSKSNQEILNFIQSVIKWKKINNKIHCTLENNFIERKRWKHWMIPITH